MRGPAAGEQVTAASVQTPFQQAANRLLATKRVLDWMLGCAPFASGTYGRSFVAGTGTFNILNNHTGSFHFDANANLVQHAIGEERDDQDYFMVPLKLPPGTQIREIQVGLFGVGHSALPSEMPTVELCEKDYMSTAVTVITGSVDDSATHSAYDTIHTITLRNDNQNTYTSQDWFARIGGEAGTNAKRGTTFVAMKIKCDPPNLTAAYNYVANNKPIDIANWTTDVED